MDQMLEKEPGLVYVNRNLPDRAVVELLDVATLRATQLFSYEEMA